MSMPAYEYICEMCTKVETIHRSIDDKLARDPYCANCTIPMKRLFTATPAIFKGNGWGAKP